MKINRIYRMAHWLIFCSIGLILSSFMAGGLGARDNPDGMKLSSPAFRNDGYLPPEYSLRGGNMSPPLLISGIPEHTKSLALIVDDPDAPRGIWVHWVLFNIPVTNRIEEGAAPGREGINDFKRVGYDGPAPPSGTHCYFFTLYALDGILDLKEGSTAAELKGAMEGHILARATLVGLFRRER